MPVNELQKSANNWQSSDNSGLLTFMTDRVKYRVVDKEVSPSLIFIFLTPSNFRGFPKFLLVTSTSLKTKYTNH